MADIYDKSPISRFWAGRAGGLNSATRPSAALLVAPSGAVACDSSVWEPALSRFQFSADSFLAQTESHSSAIGGRHVLASIALQRNSKAQARVQTQPSLRMRLLANF